MRNNIIYTPKRERLGGVEAQEARALGYTMLSAAFHIPVDGRMEGDGQLDEAFRLGALSVQLENEQMNHD